jgi:hypothetical protein
MRHSPGGKEMEDVTRRDAVKLVAAGMTAAGAVALSGGETEAQEKKKERGPGPLNYGTPPRNWGQEGDQTFKVSEGDQIGRAGSYGNNCGVSKDEIDRRFNCKKFGRCDHPTPASADVEAAEKMLQILAQGCVVNAEFGHRTVKNKIGSVTYITYLAYAAGDRR